MYSYFCRIIVRKDEQLHADEAINPPIRLVWEGELRHVGEATKKSELISFQDSKRSSEETGDFRLHFDYVNMSDFKRFKWYNQSSSHNVRVSEFKICGMFKSC